MFDSYIPGTLGDASQLVEAQANLALHQLGEPQEILSAAGIPIRGGQNPTNTAGRSARNSDDAGSSDDTEDLNASSAPPELAAESLNGSPVCEECQKDAFRLLPGGLWSQTWSDHTRSGVGFTLADPENWEGDQIYDYETDLASGDGIFSKPEGLLWHPSGRLILVHRMSESPDLLVVKAIRIHILEPGEGADDWTQVDSATIELDLDRDQNINGKDPDSQVFLDLTINRLTILSSARNTIPTGTPITDQASVWSLDIGPEANLGEVQFSEITVGGDLTAKNVSLAGPFMAKLNLLEDTIYGQVAAPEGGYTDLWESDWKDALNDKVGVSMTSRGGGSDWNTNFGYPLLNRDGNLVWCVVCSASQFLAVSDGVNSKEGRLYELQFDPLTGALVQVVTLWEQANFFPEDAVRVTDALEDAADSVQNSSEDYETSTWSETRPGFCYPGPVSYNYTYTFHSTWLGVMYEDHEYPVTDSAGGNHLYYFPGSVTLASPGFGVNPLGVRPAPPPLPARTPNLRPYAHAAADDLRQYWDGEHGNNSRLVASSDGWRYCAALVPAPYYAPPVDTRDSGGYGIVGSYSAFGSCYFKTDEYYWAGVLPQCRFVYETYLFAISPENQVTRAQLLPRHTGVHFGFPTSLEVPIPENVYQPLCIEELGCVFWLHDMRTAADADPMPTITATSRTLDILYRISASEMVPTDTFSTDQGTWAYAGEACYRYHNVNESGPLMKAFKSPDGFFLVVGLEFFDRVAPGSGDPGTTTQRTCIFKVTPDGYTLVKTSDATYGWTEPNVLTPGLVEGPQVVRSLAIGPRLVVAQNGPSLRQII